MTTPTGLSGVLAELRRLTAAVTEYGDIHQDQAQDDGDDDNEEAWLWVAVTGRRLAKHLDELVGLLAKLGIVKAEPAAGPPPGGHALSPSQQRILADLEERLADPDEVRAHAAADPQWQRIQRQLLDGKSETADPLLRQVAGHLLRWWSESIHRTPEDALDLTYAMLIAYQVETDDENHNLD